MKRIISCLFVLLLTLLLPICASAAVKVVEYTPDFYVADYANVLSDEVEGLVVLNNDRLDKACGAQIVVVTVDSVRSIADIDQYAHALFQQWSIGDKVKNNGLLILIAVQDNSYKMVLGKGLQDYITVTDLDALAAEHFTPSAQSRNFDEAIRQMFGACFDKISIAYNAGVSVDDSLYYKWNQSGAVGTDGAKFLSTPVRIASANDIPAQSGSSNTPSATTAPSSNKKDDNEFNILPFVIIAVILVAVVAFMATRPAKKSKSSPARRTSANSKPSSANGKRPATGGTRPAASGTRTTASGTRSTASGTRTTASGTRTTASGTRTTASGTRSTASGTRSTASGTRTTASGTRTTASGTRTTASSTRTTASGTRTTASGTRTTASGTRSTASGTRTTSNGTRPAPRPSSPRPSNGNSH